jgi:Zn-dependent peptidase ImmA (M78 family)
LGPEPLVFAMFLIGAKRILLNSNMDYITVQMVCGHEIGHDALHREQSKIGMELQKFTLFDIRNETKYEANAFAAHLRIDSEEFA